MDDRDESERSLLSSYLFLCLLGAGPFFKEYTLLMISSWLMSILIANKVQVQPYFVVATLISWTEVQGLAGSCVGSVWTNLPLVMRVRGFDKTTHIGSFTWYCPWAPQLCGAGRLWKICVVKFFLENSGGLEVVTI